MDEIRRELELQAGEEDKEMIFYLLQIVENLNFMENLLEKNNL